MIQITFYTIKLCVDIREAICYTSPSQQRVVRKVQTIQEDSKQFQIFLIQYFGKETVRKRKQFEKIC